jgi:hypothetical protein
MSHHRYTWSRSAAVCFLVAAGCGCSIKHVAINKLGNALASSGPTFEGDDDPELVAAAIPFGLKLYESLLAESPKHTGLLLAAASGFTEYAYAFVDLKAEEAKEESADKADALRDRARRLYLRANRYGIRGLESRYSGFGAALAAPNAFTQALTFAGLGDKDRTLEALDRLASLGAVRVGRALNSPEFALLRGDPRVKALRKRVGLPE